MILYLSIFAYITYINEEKNRIWIVISAYYFDILTTL